MLRAGTRSGASLVVVVLVLALASGLFAVQYAQAFAQCSALPGSAPCAAVSSARIAVDGLFVAIAGLLAAMVMAITAGINWRNSPAPNSALAQRLDDEETAFKREQARRAELAQLNALALAHAAASASPVSPMADTVPVSAAAATDAAGDASIVPGPRWQLEPEKPAVETADQARRRVLAERLKNLARNKPDAMAEVLKVWINQPKPGR